MHQDDRYNINQNDDDLEQVQMTYRQSGITVTTTQCSKQQLHSTTKQLSSLSRWSKQWWANSFKYRSSTVVVGQETTKQSKQFKFVGEKPFIVATKTNSQRSNHCSDLYDACLEMAWDKVQVMLVGNDDDNNYIDDSTLQYQDGDNLETCLYATCQNQPPLHIVKLLMDAWPMALITKNRHGDLPIHIACRYDASPSVIELLVHSNPYTATYRTRFGTTPIIALWEPYCCIVKSTSTTTYRPTRRTNERLSTLASTDALLYSHYIQFQEYYCNVLSNGNISSTDKFHPQLIPSNKNGIMFFDSISNEKLTNDDYNDNNLQQPSLSSYCDKWNITLKLLIAVARYRRHPQQYLIEANGHFENDDKNRIIDDKEDNNVEYDDNFILHATISLGSMGCPLWILFYITQQYKYQFRIYDQDHRLPLHIAVGPENKNATTTISNNGHSDHHQQQQQHWKFVPREYWSIRFCIENYPESVLICDPNEPIGRYPLHTAILNGHLWHCGVQLLVYAAPQVLHIKDTSYDLYPVQLAAIMRNTNMNATEELDLIYELLRCDPTILCTIAKYKNVFDDNENGTSISINNLDTKFLIEQQWWPRSVSFVLTTMLVLSLYYKHHFITMLAMSFYDKHHDITTSGSKNSDQC